MLRYKMLLSIILSVLFVAFVDGEEPDKWEVGDRDTLRLPPSDFPKLPKSVRRDLDTRGCTIPQAQSSDRQPHNVISGYFNRPDQIDWAVLCSIDRFSTLLVYWDGSSKSVLELSTTPDKQWLQSTGGDNVGFSHVVSTVSATYITEHAHRYGDKPPPVLDHEGIEDAFMGKASSIHYWYQGAWLILQGTD